MHIFTLKQAWLNTISRRARFHETESRRHAFRHDFAQLTSGLDFTLARRRYAFNSEQFTAHTRPSKARDRANLRLFF